MSRDFDWAAFHRRRKFLKVTGLVLVLAGLFTIVDLMSNVPIPLTGYRAVFFGTVLIIFGLLALYRGYRLPLEEALDIIHQKNRGITASELVHEMRVDRLTADRLIQALIAKGFLRRTKADAATVEEVFEPVR
jgi:uncharacterized membrane protein